MDIISRLNAFVGKQAGAPSLGEGTVIAVEPSRTAMQDDIERAINWSKFTLRFENRGVVTLSGMLLDQLDHNNYLIPSDCPWMELEHV